MNPPADPQGRMTYLLACFQAAQEELLLRVKQRDDWIKLQLAAQGVVVALANGVKLMGAEPDSPLLWVSALAMPVAIVFYALYVVEDRLIGHLADYIKDVSRYEADLNSAKKLIPNFDGSSHIQAFARETLPYRGLSQFVVFLLIPVGIAFGQRWGHPLQDEIDWISLGVDSLIAVIIIVVLVISYRFRARIAAGKGASA